MVGVAVGFCNSFTVGFGVGVSAFTGEGLGVGDSRGWFAFLLLRPDVFSFDPKFPLTFVGITGVLLGLAFGVGVALSLMLPPCGLPTGFD